ncbi:glycosyltransferase family 4 protein [Oceanisphaera ostreae]|uniref:Glycosyltransferase family 4 protein n=1 Tax=Oceanisphaera ostreae TaxID=914151 RepID=A0ABW3KGA5_9GAMM
MDIKKNPVFVMVLNGVTYFLSHRLPIAQELRHQGYEVHIVSPDPKPADFEQYGFIYHQAPMSRKGVNPFTEWLAIARIFKIFKAIQPNLVHLVTIKPYLYGSIAARLARVPSVVSAVAGLGIIFSQSNFKTKLLRAVLYSLFKVAFGHKNQNVIFQNKDDKQALVDWINLAESKITVIRGAGADLNQYPYLPESDNSQPVIAFAARLLKDKGVEQFVEASRLLKERGVAAKFWLIGEPDAGNANTVTQQQLDEWQQAGLVECLGYRTDIPQLFTQANIVSLPSFYGEGLPKVLIEAAACGRAVVTTDWPGCRDAITPNETGLLVPIKDSVALADAIQTLIEDEALRHKMGKAGRKLAEDVFDVNKVVEQHMNIYKTLERTA